MRTTITPITITNDNNKNENNSFIYTSHLHRQEQRSVVLLVFLLEQSFQFFPNPSLLPITHVFLLHNEVWSNLESFLVFVALAQVFLILLLSSLFKVKFVLCCILSVMTADVAFNMKLIFLISPNHPVKH